METEEELVSRIQNNLDKEKARKEELRKINKEGRGRSLFILLFIFYWRTKGEKVNISRIKRVTNNETQGVELYMEAIKFLINHFKLNLKLGKNEEHYYKLFACWNDKDYNLGHEKNKFAVLLKNELITISGKSTSKDIDITQKGIDALYSKYKAAEGKKHDCSNIDFDVVIGMYNKYQEKWDYTV